VKRKQLKVKTAKRKQLKVKKVKNKGDKKKIRQKKKM
jgi:hypothetical protein